ncbi:HEPN domain-containing protein [Streptomyces sp. OR43]|uniref:HEPN domain-containing protein n=1 Tax=Streptomyces sp. or43 TaxID=2478957 RepID=UPI0011CD9101|nr:HEPN domain-containing protein [Streptomyces sp. or43]
MPTQKFGTQLDDVEDLLDLAESITLRHPAFSYLPNRPNTSPLLAGAVVLLCARFEEFIKDVVTYALERHGEAAPEFLLWDLPERVQVLLITKNLNAALQAKRFGKLREPNERISDGKAAAEGIVAGKISAGHAIETGGNPGPDTVADLMKLTGVEKPWLQISRHFEAHYIEPRSVELSGMALGDLQERLGELVGLRNIVAHSGARIPSSPTEIRFNVHFARHLADAIYQVLKDQVESHARASGRVPAKWSK